MPTYIRKGRRLTGFLHKTVALRKYIRLRRKKSKKQITKKSGDSPLFSFCFNARIRLRFGNGADGATVFARSAIDALVRIDDIFAVTFGDCRDGAGVCARSARNAFIADNSCHGIHSFQRIGLSTENMISHVGRQFNLKLKISFDKSKNSPMRTRKRRHTAVRRGHSSCMSSSLSSGSVWRAVVFKSSSL